MSSNRNSGSIHDFFKSKTQPHQKAQQLKPDKNAAPMAAAVAKLPTPPSRSTFTPPKLPSLPSTPAKPARAANAEISDSDAEDNGNYSSDSDVEELGVLLGLTTNPNLSPKPAPSPNGGHGIFGTPKAKRTAIEFHSSPITRRPKRPKNGFDFAALARDAAIDTAILESSARADHAAEMGVNDDDSVSEDDVPGSDKGKQRLVKAATEKTGGNDQKLLRALRREQGIEPRYCFFDTQKQLPKASTPPKTQGTWRFLTQGTARAREQHLISGLPQTLAREHPAPDDLFLWMLEQITTQSSATTRAELGRIIALSDDQLCRLVTPKVLNDIFTRLGAADDLQSDQDILPTIKPEDDPYAKRDWSHLYAVLGLIAGTQNFDSLAAHHAAKVLLRLSLDSVILDHADLLIRFEEAVARSLSSILDQEWDLFCFDCCSMLLTIMKSPGIRINTLLCLPISSSRALDLRRRLATGFLFSDAKLARVQANESITLKDLIRRISAEDFTVSRKTDFVQLESKAVLLDMVVNDGSFGPIRDQNDEKEFNEAIDVLVDKLKETWGSISDVGLDLSRTHAKTTIEWVRQRLMYAVRTKKRPARDIYALAGYGKQTTEPFNVTKQREYMSSFLKKGAPSKA